MNTDETIAKKINVLVTGARGFVGRNLMVALQQYPVQVTTFNSGDSLDELKSRVNEADLIFHLAGENRPQDENDFQKVNVGLTQSIVDFANESKAKPTIVFTSSTQADNGSPYGNSKLGAENVLREYSEQGGAAAIYRLPNVFGKWSRANYNSAVATFCHRLARGEEIEIHNPDAPLTLIYVDEVVRCFLRHIDNPKTAAEVDEIFQLTVGDLVQRIERAKTARETSRMPNLADRLDKYLYSTYLSFLPEDDFAVPVDLKQDDRGWLFELIKSDHMGQIFISTTKPGVTRGNHFHHTKVEKFCLIHGKGTIRFRGLESDKIIEYPVDDKEIRVVDIPPGLTHSIENTGDRPMTVLFWANEIFDPATPDTFMCPVLPTE